jgi:hypothetical protein
MNSFVYMSRLKLAKGSARMSSVSKVPNQIPVHFLGGICDENRRRHFRQCGRLEQTPGSSGGHRPQQNPWLCEERAARRPTTPVRLGGPVPGGPPSLHGGGWLRLAGPPGASSLPGQPSDQNYQVGRTHLVFPGLVGIGIRERNWLKEVQVGKPGSGLSPQIVVLGN